MHGLSVKEAYVFEKGRNAILTAKIALLKEAKDALSHNDDAMLWQRCFSFLQNTFSKPEIIFFFKADFPPFLNAYGFASSSPGPVTGGINCLINVIGHVESEIRIGVYSKTREVLGSLFTRTKNGHGRFESAGKGTWFSAKELKLMSKAQEVCSSLLPVHHEFRQRFSTRVMTEIKTGMLDEVAVSARVLPDKRTTAEDILKNVTKQIERMSSPGATRPDANTPHREIHKDKQDNQNQFVREGNFWRLQYQGKMVNAKDSNGMKLLSILLSHPYVSFKPHDLMDSVNKPAPDAIGKEHKDNFEIPYAGESTQKILTEKEMGILKNRTAVLAEDIQLSIDDGNITQEQSLRIELEKIEDFLRKNTHKGKSRILGSDDTERHRKSSSIAIRRAISAIQTIHPDLAGHLTHSVIHGIETRYSPEATTLWSTRVSR